MRLTQCVAASRSFFQQRQAACHRALGVIVTCAVGAECRLQVVAGVAQHFAAMVDHEGSEGGKCTVQGELQVLGVQALTELGRAHDVAKQHTDLTQPAYRLDSRGWWCLGVEACGEGQLRSKRGRGEFHSRVAQRGTLALKRGNCGAQRLRVFVLHGVVWGVSIHTLCRDRASQSRGSTVAAPRGPAPHCAVFCIGVRAARWQLLEWQPEPFKFENRGVAPNALVSAGPRAVGAVAMDRRLPTGSPQTTAACQL